MNKKAKKLIKEWLDGREIDELDELIWEVIGMPEKERQELRRIYEEDKDGDDRTKRKNVSLMEYIQRR